MKSSKFLLAIVAIFSLILSGSPAFAQGDSLSDDQLQQIKSSCVSTKATLSRLHSNDALMRVNAGQLYESLSTKLMDGFNARIANNNMNNSGLVSVSNDYETTLNTFRTDYISYENQLSSAIDVDCSAKPATFYDAIANARTKRSVVYGDVVKMNKYVDDYSAAIDKFEAEYLAAVKEVTK